MAADRSGVDELVRKISGLPAFDCGNPLSFNATDEDNGLKIYINTATSAREAAIKMGFSLRLSGELRSSLRLIVKKD